MQEGLAQGFGRDRRLRAPWVKVLLAEGAQQDVHLLLRERRPSENSIGYQEPRRSTADNNKANANLTAAACDASRAVRNSQPPARISQQIGSAKCPSRSCFDRSVASHKGLSTCTRRSLKWPSLGRGGCGRHPPGHQRTPATRLRLQRPAPRPTTRLTT